MEEHDHDRGAADVEALGDMEEDAPVAVGFRLPVEASERCSVSPAAIFVNVQERGAGLRHVAPVGKRGGVERHEFGAVTLERLAAGVDGGAGRHDLLFSGLRTARGAARLAHIGQRRAKGRQGASPAQKRECFQLQAHAGGVIR